MKHWIKSINDVGTVSWLIMKYILYDLSLEIVLCCH